VTRRSDGRLGPSPAQHAEARVQALSDRLQADAEASRALLRELHEATKDARAALRELKADTDNVYEWTLKFGENMTSSLEEAMNRRTAEVNAHYDQGLAEMRDAMRDGAREVNERCMAVAALVTEAQHEALALPDVQKTWRLVCDRIEQLAREEMRTPEFLQHMAAAVQVRIDDEVDDYIVTRKAQR
jgi:uncharacterized protein YPO0396